MSNVETMVRTQFAQLGVWADMDRPCAVRHGLRKLLPIMDLTIWLGGRDSNPDNMLQRHASYRWTTSQSGIPRRAETPIIYNLQTPQEPGDGHRRNALACSPEPAARSPRDLRLETPLSRQPDRELRPMRRLAGH